MREDHTDDSTDCAADYNAAVDYIYSIPRFTKKGGIAQTKGLMAMLGNPQEAFRYIHIAGTNGKGSVSALVAEALQHMGIKTGLFTSPHLVRINERIRICGQMISDDDFVRLFHMIKEKVDAYVLAGGVHPTFFEWMYMMAMVWFQMNDVAYAVVETGLGGRLDATNVTGRPEITVITSIGYDHMQYLGTTIGQIAGEKAGIIKPGVPLVYDDNVPEASAVITRVFMSRREKEADAVCRAVSRAQARNVIYTADGIVYDTVVDGRPLKVTLSMLGTYQVANSLVALETLACLGRRQNYFGMTAQAYFNKVTEAFARTRWAGRMEKINEHLYIDGAHNDDGICALTETLLQRFRNKKLYLLFAVAEDKDYQAMIEKLCSLPDLEGVMVTAIDNERRVPVERIASLFKESGHALVKQSYNIKEALQTAVMWTGDGILCCCGSLYLAGSIEALLS